VEALPAVKAAAEATVRPLDSLDHRVFTAEGPSQAGGTPNLIAVAWVLGDYFKTLGIPLVKGRFFSPGDVTGTEQVVIINQTMARRYWPGQDAVGRRIKWGIAESVSPWMTVVGVVGDVKNGPLNTPTLPAAYVPYPQVSDSAITDETFGEYRTLHLIVRTQSEPTAFVNSIRAVIAGLDPSPPIANVGTMEQLIHRSTRPQQFNAFLISVFAGLALMLAAVGVYGVLSYTARQRTHEIGIRMALGAERADIVRLLVTEGMVLAVVGVSIGLAGALALTRFLTSMLYSVKPTDPVTFIAVPFILTLVALIASYIPARRATKVDPMVALRYE
jgi:putative ABC transport system permease protein